ncbi:transcriptional regulator, GntR family [Cyclonatronum proteinivorum]|uniref:Transcriptional regulator, GntR family n=1 Tax=Cyclonatronum proteinivorum TaxID=1457365 RepID=A0A345UL15_9BACT|nr:GntR family transcriptional regulator [Cyclonatronum proteinivorum]AXJ01167.1 transcriptional regulator, GntR family [Cyclonatronum proteinivorum]
MELKKNVPRHEQISSWLRAQIDAGVFDKDEKLPSEQELSDRFQVSRVTVRRALQTLESDEMIYRCQGLGSFVKQGKLSKNLIRLTDFMEDMRDAGKQARSEVIRMDHSKVCDLIAEKLGLKVGQMVLQLDRLRMGDNEPVAYDKTWFPILYGQLIADQELADKTIFRILEEDYEIPIIRGTYDIQACVADEEMATHLQVIKGAPLLLFDRVSYTLNDKAVYFQRRYYRADKISWQVSLERNPQSTKEPQMPLKEFYPVFR